MKNIIKDIVSNNVKTPAWLEHNKRMKIIIYYRSCKEKSNLEK